MKDCDPIGFLGRPARSGEPWWKRARGRVLLDQHLGDDEPNLLRGADWERVLQRLLDSQAELVLLTAWGHHGTATFPTTLGHQHAGLDGRDVLAFLADGLARAGRRVGVFVSAVLERRVFLAHPEWRQRRPDGSAPGDECRYGALCPLSGYADDLVARVAELAARRAFDAWFIDTPFFRGDFDLVCACASCRAGFLADRGLSIPATKDFEDPDLIEFIDWRREKLLAFVRRLRDTVRDQCAHVPFSVQFVAHPLSDWSAGQGLATAQEVSWLAHDVYGGAGRLELSFLARFFCALSPSRPFELHLARFASGLDHYAASKPPIQLLAEAATVQANGGAPLLFDQLRPDGWLGEATWKVFARVFAELGTRRPALGGEPLRWVGLLTSEENRDLHGQNDVEQRVRVPLLGWFRALLEGHLPMGIVDAGRLATGADELAGVRVLVLPSIARMSAEACAAIVLFVRNGGGLVATGELPDGLARAFGLVRRGPGPWTRMTLELGGPRGEGQAGSQGRGLDDDSDAVALIGPCSWWEGAGVGRGRLLRPAWEWTTERFASIHTNPAWLPVEATEADPGGVAGQAPRGDSRAACALRRVALGRGRVLVFSGDPARSLDRIGVPEARRVLRRAVLEAADQPAPARLDGPACVEMSAWWDGPGGPERPTVQRRVAVHLVNVQDGARRQRSGSPSLIDEILPVTGLVLRFDRAWLERVVGGAPIRARVYGETEEWLRVERRGDELVVRVARLEVYRAVVIGAGDASEE